MENDAIENDLHDDNLFDTFLTWCDEHGGTAVQRQALLESRNYRNPAAQHRDEPDRWQIESLPPPDPRFHAMFSHVQQPAHAHTPASFPRQPLARSVPRLPNNGPSHPRPPPQSPTRHASSRQHSPPQSPTKHDRSHQRPPPQSPNKRAGVAADASPSTDQEKGKHAMQPGKKRASKGTGARSGSNRRAGGESDEDIASLDPATRTDILQPPSQSKVPRGKCKWSEDEQYSTVKHITDPAVWDGFKLKKTPVFIDVSQNTLNGTKTPDQVSNWWESVWGKYKACRQREEHTGGGDGDDESDSADDVDVGAKRSKTKAAAHPRYSHAVLDAFEQSSLYDMIDAVAHDHPEVVRERPYRAETDTSDLDRSPPAKRARHRRHESLDEGSSMISSLISEYRERQSAKSDDSRRQAEIAEAQLKLAQEQAERDNRRAERELELAQRRVMLEEEGAKLQRRQARLAAYDRVMKMAESPDATVRALGVDMLKDLRDEAKADGMAI